MENKDTNTDYQKVVRVWDQKWEIVETTFGIIFFLLEICIHYFLYSFQVPPEKNHLHLKCQFPPKVTIWDKSLLYTHFEMIYSPWDIEQNILKLVILGHFLPFYPLKTPKIKILKNEKICWRYHHFTHVY